MIYFSFSVIFLLLLEFLPVCFCLSNTELPEMNVEELAEY